MKKESSGGESASALIDTRIKELDDWRGETLARIRAIIKQADPDVVEEWKWRGVPVWSHAGIICTGETYKTAVKMTFAKGASLDDPSGLFNASLEGNTRRAIDLHEGDVIDEQALKALIRAAVVLNTSR
ncbi:hypothetical protein B723_24125 [Pseudomonas fluorescens NCIMB 11764]|uniref:YdhG-like domain-containing protein n=1 Tax=Pseudomonas fluorescens NCIMB 11764 TaxID=1221522 RepID=A0A0K1QUC8_PSEFL|nr:DUF1801 domain-containing protein [Pseudomonas fluorescens]AKV09313.1 hypothetical protein B723_24125 [Pseudomonas fluorescens NCIMB 11764]